jgi:hypothetical protein
MIRLIQAAWDLCILKIGPQDLPTSPALLSLALLAYFITGAAVALLQWSSPQALLAALLDTVLFTVLCYVLLWTRMLGNRFTQTMTALAGSGSLLALIAVPLVYWQKQLGLPANGALTFPALLLFVWSCWNISVVGHILRHALSTAFALGLGLAVVYAYILLQLFRIFVHE